MVVEVVDDAGVVVGRPPAVVVVGGRPPAIVVEVAVVRVEVVVLDGAQTPLVVGFCRLQSFTKPWQPFRCAACVFRQAFFSGFVPTQDVFVGTNLRQSLMSCLQSLRQWLALAASPSR